MRTQKEINDRINNYYNNSKIGSPMTCSYIMCAVDVLQNLPKTQGDLDFEIKSIEKGKVRTMRICARWREFRWLGGER